MRLLFIIIVLLGSFFAFSREMEPGSEYYNLSVELIRDINSLDFNDCPNWTTVIEQQEFLCASFSGDSRNFPILWDDSLAQVINQYNLQDALEWSIGELGINKMYSMGDSIMSVTLESDSSSSQLVIYVARPLSFESFATSPTPSTSPSATGLQSVTVPSTSQSNIVIQATPQISQAPPQTATSNPSANFSDVATSTVPNNFYGYPTYEAYLEAYRLKVTNPATNSQPLSTTGSTTNTGTTTYSANIPAYCITYPTRPECSSQNQQTQQVQQQPAQQYVDRSYNGYPSYEAYLQAFRQRYEQQTQVAQTPIPTQSQPYQQGFAGFPSYEAYLQDYNSRYGQAGQINQQPSQQPVVQQPVVQQPVVQQPVVQQPVTQQNTQTNTQPTSTASSDILSLGASGVDSNNLLGKITTRGFRNVPWGSTPNRTKDIETWELVDEGLAKDEAYYLAYDGEVLGTKVLAVYYFSPKTKILGRGAYIFMGDDEMNSQQVTRHTSLHNMLGEDYGSPNRNEKLWLNESAKGMRDIDALETGDMLYVTQWDDEQIGVELSLFASNEDLMNRVLYSSKLFSVVIDEEIN